MSRGTQDEDNDERYTRPTIVQIKGRVPKASSDLFSWAVHVAGMVTEPGRRTPTQNTCVIAALEDWAAAVLTNHPGAAEAGLTTLTQDPNFGEVDRNDLVQVLMRLELDDLIASIGPTATGPDAEAKRPR